MLVLREGGKAGRRRQWRRPRGAHMDDFAGDGRVEHFFRSLAKRRVDILGGVSLKGWPCAGRQSITGQNMSRKTAILFTCVFAVLMVALLSAGTPLMWGKASKFAFGNLLIGVFEGYLLAKFFKLLKWKTIGLLIAANCFSAWVGRILGNRIEDIFPCTLDNPQTSLWGMAATACCSKLLLEFPFVVLAFWRDPKWLKKSLLSLLIMQILSYTLLLGWIFWLIIWLQ